MNKRSLQDTAKIGAKPVIFVRIIYGLFVRE